LGVLLFVMPIVGAVLPLITVDLIVPRTKAIDLLPAIVTTSKAGAATMAAFYHVAISAAITIILCLVSIGWSGFRLNEILTTLKTQPEKRWFKIAIAVAIVLPVGLLALQFLLPPSLAEKLALDDEVTRLLFDRTIRKDDPKSTAMRYDAPIVGCFVFVAFLLATATVAATTASKTQTAPAKPDDKSGSVLNTALFLTAGVLVAAMVTAKFRFDVGLSMMGDIPTPTVKNPAYSAFQVVASAIMAYWAAVLSLCLALIYVPSATILNGGTSALADLFTFNRENGVRLLKLAAIVSPPVINKLIETFATLPKAT
jgi:hypothetical protein